MRLNTDCFYFRDLSLLMYVLQCGDALCSIFDARLRNYAAFNCANTGIACGNSKIDLVANQKHVCSSIERIDHGLINCRMADDGAHLKIVRNNHTVESHLLS